MSGICHRDVQRIAGTEIGTGGKAGLCTGVSEWLDEDSVWRGGGQWFCRSADEVANVPVYNVFHASQVEPLHATGVC